MELIDFLRARLDEDKAAALAADVKQGDPDWWVSEVKATAGERFTVRSRQANRPIARVTRLDGYEGEPAGVLDGRAVAEHIARHDPARVLRQVAALRRIVDGCAEDVLAVIRPRYAEWVLCALAGTWADHPDYDPAWTPEEART